MRPRTWLIALVAGGGAFLAVASSAQAACTGSTPARTTLADAAGDAGTAPDLTGVTVALDAACRFSVSPEIQTFADDAVLLTFLDRDGNAATGSPDFDGADILVATLGTEQPVLAVWDGSDFAFVGELAGATAPSPGGFNAGVDQLAIEPGATVGVRVVAMRSSEEDDFSMDWAPEPEAPAGIQLAARYEGAAIVPSAPPPSLDPVPTLTPPV